MVEDGKDYLQPGDQIMSRWLLNISKYGDSMARQLVPAFGPLHSYKVFPNVQMTHLVFHFVSIVSCLITKHH